MDVTRDDARNLVAKLAAMDLTDGERALLDAVFIAAAGEQDVSGFGFAPAGTSYTEVEWTYLTALDGLVTSRPRGIVTNWDDMEK